jgi:hypothetical protein
LYWPVELQLGEVQVWEVVQVRELRELVQVAQVWELRGVVQALGLVRFDELSWMG